MNIKKIEYLGLLLRLAGLLFFRTTSPGQLAFLNNLVGVFEYQSDKQENASSKIWA
jgi:hypothetical protein